MLATAAGGEVRAEDFVWEERGGLWSDTVLGRRVLFLAKTDGGRDLFRARVRLTRAGQPIDVRATKNLTQSPEGDDAELVAQGRRVAFVTTSRGAVRGVTLLALGGAREAPKNLAERFRAALDRWSSTGSVAGVDRTEVVFEKAPPEVKIELEGDLLVMALGAEALPAALDARTHVLDTGDKNPFGARAHAIPASAPAWPAFIVARANDAFGAAAARRVESLMVSVGETFARKAAPLPAVSGPIIIAPSSDDKAIDARPRSTDWPPEGVTWHAPSAPDGLLPVPKDGPPYLLEGSVDVDGASVRLVAIDTRRLDLGLAAGTEQPRASTGLHGVGRIPPASASRTVAVLATGPAEARLFRDPAARVLGFVVDRSPFSSMVPGAPTIAFTLDGAVKIGVWPFEGAFPADLASGRQTPPAFVGGSNDARPGDGDRPRSALCLLAGGQLAYAYARRIDSARLSHALHAAACSFALPLAAAPADVGFAYLHRHDGAAPDAPDAFVSAPLTEEMPFSAEAIARGLRGDFAFVTLRDERPSPPLPSGAWEVDAAKQPSPAYLPAIFTATLNELGAQVHLTAFMPGRFTFHLRAGHRELANRLGGGWQTELPSGDLARALAAIGVGAGRKKSARGLATDGSIGLPFRADSGVLSVDARGISITKSDGFTPGPRGDATELPLTADQAKLRPEAREVGTMRPRAAACALDDGTFLVALTTFDTDEANTQALLALGCVRVVALDRGSHHSAFVSRAGAEPPIEKRYDASALYALESPATGRASKAMKSRCRFEIGRSKR